MPKTMTMADRVEALHHECLFKPSDTPGATAVKGTLGIYMYCPARLEGNRLAIISLLSRLSEKVTRGTESMHFAFLLQDGKFWTQDRAIVDHLVTMGVALGLVTYTGEPKAWTGVLGGYPVITISLPGQTCVCGAIATKQHANGKPICNDWPACSPE